MAHVLVHFVKSFRAYNGKSSSIIQYPIELQDYLSQCKISHQAWLQLDQRILGPSKMGLFRPLNNKTLISFKRIRMNWTNKIYLQAFKTFVEVETNKVLYKSVVEDHHLVTGFETACSERSRFERVGCKKFLCKSPIFFANS